LPITLTGLIDQMPDKTPELGRRITPCFVAARTKVTLFTRLV
jgi:hypothetical protein